MSGILNMPVRSDAEATALVGTTVSDRRRMVFGESSPIYITPSGTTYVLTKTQADLLYEPLLNLAANEFRARASTGAAANFDISDFGLDLVAANDAAAVAALLDFPDLSGYTISDDGTLAGASHTALTTEFAVKTYADSLVANLLDLRSAYDASSNLFPSTGGSGTAGAILKGDTYPISVGGTLGGQVVAPGDMIIALVDAPGQTSSNWNKLETNIGYVPLNAASNLSDLVGPLSTARTNLELGLLNTPTFAALNLAPATDTTGLSITGYSVTGSGTTNGVSIAGTWNTSGAPTALDVNITNTASATASRLFSLRVAGSPVFGVQATGMTSLVSSSTSVTAGGVGSTARIDIRNSSNTANNFATISYTGNSGNIAATMAAQFTDHTNSIADYVYTVRVGGTLTQAMTLKGSASGGTNGGWLGLGTTSPDRLMHVEATTALTNAVNYGRRQTHITSGTATTGFGAGDEFELENASGTNRVAAAWEYAWSDATNASEDCAAVLKLMKAGTLATALSVDSLGAITVAGTTASTSSTTGSIIAGGGLGVAGDTWIGGKAALKTSDALVTAHGAMGATETFDASASDVHSGTLDANCTFTLSNPSASGRMTTLIITTLQDGTGGWTITWPASVKADPASPAVITTLNTRTRYVLTTDDGGTTWYRSIVFTGVA